MERYALKELKHGEKRESEKRKRRRGRADNAHRKVQTKKGFLLLKSRLNKRRGTELVQLRLNARLIPFLDRLSNPSSLFFLPSLILPSLYHLHPLVPPRSNLFSLASNHLLASYSLFKICSDSHFAATQEGDRLYRASIQQPSSSSQTTRSIQTLKISSFIIFYLE